MLEWKKFALCPLDDRYAERVNELREFFTEPVLIRARAEVEVTYLIALSRLEEIEELPLFSPEETQRLNRIWKEFNDEDLAEARKIEKKINHDVKNIEYWLQKKCHEIRQDFPIQFIHFGLTSEDITNVAYGLLINRCLAQVIYPTLKRLFVGLEDFAAQYMDKPFLGMTHGQGATPPTIGEQISVFSERLRGIAEEDLDGFRMNGKFSGMVGNFSAHRAAYPAIEWREFGENFLSSVGLNPLYYTKQINSHDDLARLSDLMKEINGILIDLSVDMWLYISRGVFGEKVVEEEVGSSTSPAKVNPLDWENAEGNCEIANALFNKFSEKLPRSRMQRDLSDSTVQRWIGCAFGAHLLAVKSCLKGLGKLKINEAKIKAELVDHPDIHGEAIQTVMRRYGYTDAYEQVKAFTRGKKISRQVLVDFVRKLERVPVLAQEQLVERILEHSQTV